jgi:RimJ/RimL family protein N-acetyltransferase
VKLRAPLPRDAAAVLGILGDPEVTRYYNVPTSITLAEAQALLERLEQRYAARDTIRWAIELVEPSETIGSVGLLRFDFEHRHAELGYEMARRWWGHGLTPENRAMASRHRRKGTSCPLGAAPSSPGEPAQPREAGDEQQ